MSDNNQRKAIKFLLLFLLCMECFVWAGGDGEVRCIAREREALLKFKKDLTDEGGIISSWGSEEDCCKWEGVVCSNTTGHVTGVLLGRLWSGTDKFGGKISSSLLELQKLKKLDLRGNNFGGVRIPDFLGFIRTLEYLDLSFSNFSGIIPPQLGNLTNLRMLDLAHNQLWSDNLNWLSHLSLLASLDLTYTNISDANWLQHVLSLPSLQGLTLDSCTLNDAPSSADLFVNSSSTSLSFLSLAQNELTSSTFDWLFNVSMNLDSISLYDNKLDGPIPDSFAKLIFLEYLDFRNNNLDHGIPKSLGNSSHLKGLDLSRNDLTGSLEDLFGNRSCKALEWMRRSNNQFTGLVPDLRACSQLTSLDLRHNRLTGSVPLSLGQLSKLEYLDISFNKLVGTVSEAHLMELHNLKGLDLSYNSLTINLRPDWVPPFHLHMIYLASCKMGPSVPTWLRTQSNLTHLDISAAGISDEVPKWLWYLSAYSYLNISHNQITGTIPDLSSSAISMLDVGYNKFSGPVPFLHPENRIVQLSSNKFSGSISSICPYAYCGILWLDVSDNQLTGELPSDWKNMKDLEIFNANYNYLSGEIPRDLGSLQKLKTLHLRYNDFSGELPSTLKNCRLLQQIDIVGNRFTGNIPRWLGENYMNLAFLSLRQNRFHGDIPLEICKLTQIQLLDLSENHLTGKIPECFDNFTALVEKNRTTFTRIYIYVTTNDYIDHALVQWKGQKWEYTKTLGLVKHIDLSSNRLVGRIPRSFSSLNALHSLNLSGNSLTGNIISDIGQMQMLEALDLSRNQLSGEIPISMAQLHYLSVLHLENNDLTGPIPISTQLQSINASAYAWNNGLCGRPLPSCLNTTIDDQGEEINNGDGGFLSLSRWQELCISIFLGFFVGFWGVVGSLVLKKSWRRAYFDLLDDVGHWLCMKTLSFLTKFRRS